MKRIFTILSAVILTGNLFAQAPQKMSYQAVVRNASGALIKDDHVGVRISILQGTPDGTEVYKEIYNPNPQTNVNGLVTIEIGTGIPLTGIFSGIDWSGGPYFIKTETDPLGGTDYSISGTSELLSVPYALYAANGVPVHYIGESYGGGIVFYVYDGGRHGLIAATTDQSEGIKWFNGVFTWTNAIKDSLNSGQANTERIVLAQGSGWYAAQYCSNYKGGGFGDWYLPSKYELNLLYLHQGQVGGFANAPYWSSTEVDDQNAYFERFTNGIVDVGDKSVPAHVRAIRAF